MTQVTVLPVASYAAGAYAVPATSIVDTVTSLQIAVQRCTTADTSIWPLSSTTIQFDLEMSVDNGATWQVWNSPSSGSGGITTVKGTEQPLMYVQGSIPAGTLRKVRGTVTLSAVIKTGATITVL